jgi:hypothetical protein
MAQPGMQSVAIQPNVRIRIGSTGIPDNEDAHATNNQVIEFQSDPQTNQAWLIQFYDIDDESLFPLTTYVPPAGGKSYVVVDYDGGPEATVSYDVEAYTGALAKKTTLGGGKYSITISSGQDGE